MSRYTIAPSAKKDLNAIYDYIFDRSPSAADRLVDKFFATFRLLASQPGMGQPRDDLIEGVRVFSVSPYVICYRVKNDRVQITHIIHAARDFERVLSEEQG
jgi:toxin ParE1/3/4